MSKKRTEKPASLADKETAMTEKHAFKMLEGAYDYLRDAQLSHAARAGGWCSSKPPSLLHDGDCDCKQCWDAQDACTICCALLAAYDILFTAMDTLGPAVFGEETLCGIPRSTMDAEAA